MKKILKPIGVIALIVLFFSLPTFENAFTSLRRDTKRKKYVEGELERLVNNYGLKIQNPIADFNSCEFRYELYKSGIKLNLDGYIDKKLKDKDIFMVNCIPIIREIENECDAWDEANPYDYYDETCFRDPLDQFAIEN